jgi:glycosyltransferase involved in cell wall biosynthesis
MPTKIGGPPLSVTIVAKNEERTIGDVLRSVADLADEIVLLDSGSTDRTLDLARDFGVRVYHQEWLGFAAQKNRAIELATGEWILSLDGDEVLTPELQAEIRELLQGEIANDIAGFRIPRVLFIGDRAVRGGGFYPDAQLRLFRRGRGRFGPRLVHESVAVEGRVRQLRHDMLHYAYVDIDDYARTMDEYARLSARHYFMQGDTGWHSSRLNEALTPAWTFFYRQVVRGGMLRGPLCWRLNRIYAGYVSKKIRYLRELRSAPGASE